jgi:hypothetical protein
MSCPALCRGRGSQCADHVCQLAVGWVARRYVAQVGDEADFNAQLLARPVTGAATA